MRLHIPRFLFQPNSLWSDWRGGKFFLFSKNSVQLVQTPTAYARVSLWGEQAMENLPSKRALNYRWNGFLMSHPGHSWRDTRQSIILEAERREKQKQSMTGNNDHSQTGILNKPFRSTAVSVKQSASRSSPRTHSLNSFKTLRNSRTSEGGNPE